jgi:hypothetical protein
MECWPLLTQPTSTLQAKQALTNLLASFNRHQKECSLIVLLTDDAGCWEDIFLTGGKTERFFLLQQI